MNKRTLLIVDDQPVNRKILNRILEDEYCIIEANDGEEALNILHNRSGEISAVILDIIMPVMDGYAVLQAIQQDVILSKIPVIVSSQREGEEEEVKALSLGAQDFIPKPYKADIIRHRLNNTIRLHENAAVINRMRKDELTGLYNQQSFMERVKDQLSQNPNSKYDILCIGVEQFQLISDIFGQKKSNELLCMIADELCQFNSKLKLCSRFETNEFYLLYEHQDSYSDDIFTRWEKKINQISLEMVVRLYCGIYPINDASIPIGKMCSLALLAAQKNQGRYDCHCNYYDESIREKLLEEQFIVSNMQIALEQHQFTVYYQPKYDLGNEYIAGAEALVRWNHPEKGLLSPGTFIPLFEKNGFITRLDQYVWEAACHDLREWINQGLSPIAISVNVSRADIYNPKLMDILMDLISRYEIPIQYLHLEITESAYTTNPEQIITVVSKLRNQGFIIEMDDFGSGYSSLNMLAEMPVDILKLDMGFIQHETTKTSGKGILSFVISLAKWLDLIVVAEGVETGEQISILRSMDYNYVQGFYYSKPMKNEEFEHLLRTSMTTEMLCFTRLAKHAVIDDKPQNVYCKDHEMMIVDDIELNRDILAGTFYDEYRIVEKSNGSEAWEYLQSNYKKVEIVLLDLLMPVMDGFQLLAKIRADQRMKNLPVIITSQGDQDSEHRALNMQADDFIAKPYNTDIIKHRVHNVVASYRLQMIQHKDQGDIHDSSVLDAMDDIKQNKSAWDLVRLFKPYFDIVRLIDPEHTLVYGEDTEQSCHTQGCFSVWGKVLRCCNCISLEALRKHTRLSKLEHSDDGIFFVISQYVPYGENGAVIEMVTRLSDEYTDNASLADLTDELNRSMDITSTELSDPESKPLQEKQNQLVNQLKKVIHNVPGAVCLYEWNGSKLIPLIISEKYAQMLGTDVVTILHGTTKMLHMHVHPEDLAPLKEAVMDAINNTHRLDYTYRSLNEKTGNYLWIDLQGNVIEEKDGTKYCYVTYTDVSKLEHLRKTEEALGAAKKANEAKTEFFSRMSHDMRTPMNGILGLAELSEDETSLSILKENIRKIKTSGQYLLGLINDTLDLQNIESGRLVLDPQIVYTRDMVDNVLMMIEDTARRKGVAFRMKTKNADLDCYVKADPMRMKQIFLNLLSNAIKFTPRGGTVEVMFECIGHTGLTAHDRITVSDTGIGMSEQFLKNGIFQPFSQEYNAITATYAGTGLGLMIAKKLVELMGGSIEVTSELGVGSKFIVNISFERAKASEIQDKQEDDAKRIQSAMQSLNGKHILLAEDHPLNAEIAIKLLKKAGCQVTWTKNGQECLEQFCSLPADTFDVVLMDIRMPVMDGLTATEKIRSLDQSDAKKIPIIAMTANAYAQDIEKSRSVGMNEHLAKPVDPQKMYAAIAKVLADCK